jgi:hypothetical protein
MMSPDDLELAEYLDGISFTDDKDKDWKDKPELGEDPDDVDDDEDEDDDENEDDDDDENEDIIE